MHRGECPLSAGKDSVDINLNSLVIDDENYHHEFSNFINACRYVTQRLHNEQSWADLSRSFQGNDFIGEDIEEDIDLGICENVSTVSGAKSDHNYSDSTNYSDSSPPLSSCGSSETVSRLLSSSFRPRAEPLLSISSHNAIKQPVLKATPTFRQILPFLAEQSSISIDNKVVHPPTENLQVIKTNNYSIDSVRERRKTTKPEQCGLCPQRFSYKRGLKRHYVVWHKLYAVSIGLLVGHFNAKLRDATRNSRGWIIFLDTRNVNTDNNFWGFSLFPSNSILGSVLRVGKVCLDSRTSL